MLQRFVAARLGIAPQGLLIDALVGVRHHFYAAGAVSLAANLLMLTPTLYMLQVFERVLNSHNLTTLLAVSVVAVVSLLMMAWSDRRRNRRLISASVQLDDLLAPQVMDAARQAAVGGVREGEASALGDLARLRQFITGPATVALFDVPWAPVYVAVLWLLHPWLGLSAMGFMALQMALAARGSRLTAAAALPVGKADQAAQGYLQHKFRQSEAVEAMGMASGLWQRWEARHALQMQAASAAQSLANRVQAVSRFTRYAQQSLALGLGGWLVVRGELGVGAMIAANVLANRALAPIDALAGGWQGLQAALLGARRLDALLQGFRPTLPAPQVPDFAGAIGLDVQQVSVPGSAVSVLHDIHLHLCPGTVTVLMGPSGAGKSTLARVLAGAWPGGGEGLSHDDRRLSEPERLALGSRMGYLPQEIELADATVHDNIARLGRANPQAVIDAARRCGLHDAILRLPKGYDTLLGPSGHPLSGGTRQRIALARAVYGEPPLLILDEPNAHLDDSGEAALVELLREHKQGGGTALVVSHRRGVLSVADRVLVMEAGRIVADGPGVALQGQQRSPEGGQGSSSRAPSLPDADRFAAA